MQLILIKILLKDYQPYDIISINYKINKRYSLNKYRKIESGNIMKNSEKEEIKKLIKHGFDLELISFELDIPIEEVKQCELELRELPKVKLEKSIHNNNQRRKIVRKQKHTKI